jgi:hypothetical protein
MNGELRCFEIVSLPGFVNRRVGQRSSEVNRMKLTAGTMKCYYCPRYIAVARSRMA